MPKISDERKTERLEQILEGARRCFAEHGYEGATVAKLEREIGLSRGAIFNYFPSKEDLFLALAQRDNERLVRLWMEKGWEAILREVVDEDPDWIGVYIELSRRERTDPDFRRRHHMQASDVLASELVEYVAPSRARGGSATTIAPRRSRASSASSRTESPCRWAAVSRFGTWTRSSSSCGAAVAAPTGARRGTRARTRA